MGCSNDTAHNLESSDCWTLLTLSDLKAGPVHSKTTSFVEIECAHMYVHLYVKLYVLVSGIINHLLRAVWSPSTLDQKVVCSRYWVALRQVFMASWEHFDRYLGPEDVARIPQVEMGENQSPRNMMYFRFKSFYKLRYAQIFLTHQNDWERWCSNDTVHTSSLIQHMMIDSYHYHIKVYPYGPLREKWAGDLRCIEHKYCQLQITTAFGYSKQKMNFGNLRWLSAGPAFSTAWIWSWLLGVLAASFRSNS